MTLNHTQYYIKSLVNLQQYGY